MGGFAIRIAAFVKRGFFAANWPRFYKRGYGANCRRYFNATFKSFGHGAVMVKTSPVTGWGRVNSSACNVACSNVAFNGELFPRVGFIVTNLGQPAKRVVPVLQPAGDSGTVDQGRQRRQNAGGDALSAFGRKSVLNVIKGRSHFTRQPRDVRMSIWGMSV